MRRSKLCFGVLALLLIASCATKNEEPELNGVSPTDEGIPLDDKGYDYDYYPGDTNQSAADSNIESGGHPTALGDDENNNSRVWDSSGDDTAFKVTISGSNEDNQTVVLVCDAQNVPAEINFLPWIHMWGSRVIREGLHGRMHDHINELIIDNVSLQDMGTYICFGKSRIIETHETKMLTESINLNVKENKGRLSAMFGLMVTGVSALLIVGIVVIITVVLIKQSSWKQGKQSREESEPGKESTTVNIVYVLAGEVTSENEYLRPKTTDDSLCSEIPVMPSEADSEHGCKNVVLKEKTLKNEHATI